MSEAEEATRVFTDSPQENAESFQTPLISESLNVASIVNQNYARDPAIATKPLKRLFSHDERADFYSGEDRHTLKSPQVQRVRELQEMNDELQRQIMNKRKEIAHSPDELSLIADMEHCSIMIARNTGEILKIYNENEVRLKRISEIEAENGKLRETILEMRDKFITNHDIQQRTKYACEFFFYKDKLEQNIAELYDLNKD